MKQFSDLINQLFFHHSYEAKKNLIINYLRANEDPDRGYALAILAEELRFQHAKPNIIKKIILEKMDNYLFELSYDYVGDLSETVALLWPTFNPRQSLPKLHDIINSLKTLPKEKLQSYITFILDLTDYSERWAFLKLITGSLRVGVSTRFIKKTLAEYGNVSIHEIDEIWPQSIPPYIELLKWLEKKTDKPELNPYCFRTFMLSHPINEIDLKKLNLEEFFAEWKWDGIRVQAIGGDQPGLYSRTGDNILSAFPELIDCLKNIHAVIDGELLVRFKNGSLGNFNALQQRLNRRNVTKKMQEEFPAWIMCYDLLSVENTDLRNQPLFSRRQQLETLLHRLPDTYPLDLSPLIQFFSLKELRNFRKKSGKNLMPCEGIMLKHKESHYIGGRKKGYWYKWKRDPYLIDAVLMYASRGTGKRSSFYSDYTFGLWDKGVLLPVGKAYFGFTDAELKQLDRWIRQHVSAKFGPVRQVEPRLVFEVAFEDIRFSERHKSGIALRFPRIHRIRWDKPAEEADQLTVLIDLAKSKNS